jgi:hypothetical protein
VLDSVEQARQFIVVVEQMITKSTCPVERNGKE